MSKLNIAPTKSNLLSLKESLDTAKDGYDLLDQKREILVMELLHLVEKVKMLEKDMDKVAKKTYPALKNMLLQVGQDRAQEIAKTVHYDFNITKKPVTVAGMQFSSIDVVLPKKQLFYSPLSSFPECDLVMSNFFDYLTVITQMASIRTIVWRLVVEVQKTQRRVNALNKMVIPQTQETLDYIEGVLEERERENIFVLKALKNKNQREQESI